MLSEGEGPCVVVNGPNLDGSGRVVRTVPWSRTSSSSPRTGVTRHPARPDCVYTVTQRVGVGSPEGDGSGLGDSCNDSSLSRMYVKKPEDLTYLKHLYQMKNLNQKIVQEGLSLAEGIPVDLVQRGLVGNKRPFGSSTGGGGVASYYRYTWPITTIVIFTA